MVSAINESIAELVSAIMLMKSRINYLQNLNVIAYNVVILFSG